MEQELSRRAFLKTAGIAVAATGLSAGALSLFGCASASAPTASGSTAASGAGSDLIPATLGYWGGTCESPIFIGIEKGFFEEAGVAPNVLQITSDVIPLMANDELHCFELTPDKFKPIQNGLEVKIIDSLHKGCIGGAASVASGIKTVADLEGKKISCGVGSMGSIQQIQISSQMVKLGKNPKLVDWVDYPMNQLEAALDAGEIDGFAAYDPWPSIAWKNGKTRFYSNTFDDGLKEFLCCFVGLSDKALARPNGPELAKRLSAGFKKSCAFIEANPEEAAEIIQTAGYIAGDAELNAQCIKDYTWIAGDKKLIDDSVNEIWMQIYRAGALGDAPTDPADLQAYIDRLRNSMVKYYGA